MGSKAERTGKVGSGADGAAAGRSKETTGGTGKDGGKTGGGTGKRPGPAKAASSRKGSGSEKEAGSRRERKLTRQRRRSTKELRAGELKEVDSLAADYMSWLERARTERLAVEELEKLALEAGFVPLPEPGGKPRGGAPRAGKGYYMNFRGKALVLAVLGTGPLEEGMNIVGTHLDSPRLDLKQQPVYEDGGSRVALLRTHYYGGMKKYQWTNIPLSLHGVVMDSRGRKIRVDIGSSPGDPVFVVPDLEPHLGKSQRKRRLEDGIRGEELQLLAAHEPLGGKDAVECEDPIRLALLKHLNDEYGLVEEDLISAELSAVPAMGVRDVGLDRSLIGGYGHDDRGCSFASYAALDEVLAQKDPPVRTAVAVMYDKEEIGSDSPGAARSNILELFTDGLLELTVPGARSSRMRRCLERSTALSADVKSGINPCFKGVQDPNNAALLGYGVTITKYTGRGGKYAANDASAETVGDIRALFNAKGIVWQASETGKVDEGGGGTVAKFMAAKNMDVLDVGLPVLSMHSTFEVIAKADLWMMRKAMREFYLS